MGVMDDYMDRKDMNVKRHDDNQENQWKNRLNELKTLSRSTQMLTNSPSEDEVKRLSLPNVRRNNREIRGVSKENSWSKPLSNVFSVKQAKSVNRLHRSSSSSSLSSSSSSFSNQGERVFHLPEKDVSAIMLEGSTIGSMKIQRFVGQKKR